MSKGSMRTRASLFRTATFAHPILKRGASEQVPLYQIIIYYYYYLLLIIHPPPQLFKMVVFVPSTKFLYTPVVHKFVVQQKFVLQQQVLNYSRLESCTPLVLYTTPFAQEKIVMNVPCPVKVVKC
eukprot:GHVT01093486.1.p1 GENE.GHVT01093486.1~~GHVT01093486.1.p1  ORF type:complete len:139 (-),score=7.42 GHVT01093486.1:88-462(-)